MVHKGQNGHLGHGVGTFEQRFDYNDLAKRLDTGHRPPTLQGVVEYSTITYVLTCRCEYVLTFVCEPLPFEQRFDYNETVTKQ